MGNALPSVFNQSMPVIAYWVVLALFLLSLLVTTTALGTWWGNYNYAGRRRDPLVASSALWLVVASVVGMIIAWGAEASWSETLSGVFFASSLLGLAVGLASLIGLSRRSPTR